MLRIERRMGCRRAAPTLSASTSRSACPSSSGAQVLTVRKHPPRARAAVKRRHTLQRARWRGGRQAHARTGLEARSIQHAPCNGTQRANVRDASTEYYALWVRPAAVLHHRPTDRLLWECRRAAALKRGMVFEVLYAPLLRDSSLRRQALPCCPRLRPVRCRCCMLPLHGALHVGCRTPLPCELGSIRVASGPQRHSPSAMAPPLGCPSCGCRRGPLGSAMRITAARSRMLIPVREHVP
jgi:hypothetical protein